MIKQINANTIVQSTHIIGTDVVYFSVWEKVDGIMPCVASTFTSFTEDGIEGWFGRVGTDPVLSGIEFDSIPVGDERSSKVRAAYQSRYDHAYETIKKVVEFNRDVDCSDGEIRVRTDDLTGEWVKTIFKPKS